MIVYVVIDFETWSACDLIKCGAWRYSEDITTAIACLGYGVDGGEPELLKADDLMFRPNHQLAALVVDPQVIFIAHNVGFEKAIWRNIMMKQYGWPNIPNSRWHDSMAVCAQKALPLKLEKAAAVLRLWQQKDTTGSRVVKGLSKTDRKGYYDHSQKVLDVVYEYNRQDIRSETELNHTLGGLQTGERNVWLLDQRINERGARVDLKYVSACQRVVREASVPLLAEFQSLTSIDKAGSPVLKEWAAKQGVVLKDLKKDTIKALLKIEDDNDDEDDYENTTDDDLGNDGPGDTPLFRLPKNVYRALNIRRQLAGAAVKKLPVFERTCCADGRVRGLLQYHGAGPGRWNARLVQPHNFPRGSLKVDGEPPPPSLVAEALLTGDYRYVEECFGEALEVVASGLRHAIVPAPGREFNVGDYSTVECRLVLALAGQHDKTAIMAAGQSPYVPMAEQIFHRPVSKKNDVFEYTIGKNTVLGCGFQMGWETFKKRYCPNESDAFAKKAVAVYREEWAPKVPKVWEGLEEAALRAVWDKRPQEAFGVLYAHEDRWLTARLPSGRKLYYFNPQPIRKAMKWDETDIRPAWTCQAQKQGRWITRDMYGGLLTENVIQALARDLLVDAMFKCEKENLPIILTVHDEIVCEPLTQNSDHEMLRQIMSDRPRWAVDMQVPIAAETWAGDRYAKK